MALLNPPARLDGASCRALSSPMASRPQHSYAPMTLANMRALGVGAIDASCYCGHRGIVDVAHLGEHVTVPSLQRRFKCTRCGSRPMDVRPNWLERVKPGVGMGS